MTLLETGEWEEDLRELMLSDPGHTGAHYARALRDYPYDYDVRKREVNHVLYSSRAYRRLGDSKSPEWYLVDTSVPLVTDAPVPRQRSVPNVELVGSGGVDADGWELVAPRQEGTVDAPLPKRDWDLAGWQREAHDQWFESGCSGIVEAVTGSGKTRLAIAIIGHELDRQRQVLVLVPKIALQRQWATDIAGWFPECRIELVGGDGIGRPSSRAQVIVGVVNTVANRWTEFSAVDTVIADEVHNYGAMTFRRSLLPHADRRLGLTATLERLDDAVEEILEPYFGGVIYRCGFARAHQDGRLATARIGMVGVHFSEDDQQAYVEASETMTAMRTRLIRQFGVPEQPFSEFMKAVAAMSKDRFGTPASVAAGKYLKARKERSDLLAFCPAKLDMIVDLSTTIKEAGGTLIFAERVGAAESLSARLRDEGLQMPPYHSDIPVPQREVLLSELRSGNVDGLSSAKALDEGIDVPDVDLGIIAAGTQQRRQMVQRLGRVLRPKAGGGPGRFLIAYVHGTIEDPATGAHEGFLEMVGEIPGQVRIFHDVSDVNDIAQFLAGDNTYGIQLPAHLATEVVAEPQDPGETVPAGQPSTEGPDGIPVDSFAGEPEVQELDQPDHETEMASENARLRSATEVLKDSMTRIRSRWEDAQDEVRSLEQALDQSTEKQAELLRRLAERATELSTVTAQRDEARRERDVATRAAEEVRAEATPRMETDIVRLQGLLAEYMARAAQLEEANAHLAHRVEQAEGRSAAACNRVAELEHRLRRFEAASTDGTRHAASPQDRQVKTVGGARISTSMTPDKLRALGDLLSRTQAR